MEGFKRSLGSGLDWRRCSAARQWQKQRPLWILFSLLSSLVSVWVSDLHGAHGPAWRLCTLHIEPEISWAYVRIPRFSGTLPQCEDKFNFSSLPFQSFLDQAEPDNQLHKPGRQKGGPWEGLRQRGDCPWSVRAELVGTIPRWQGPWGDHIPEGRVTGKTRPPAPLALLPPAPG